jgi:hypothetical protein
MSKEKREARCALTPLAFYHVPAARRGRRRPTPFHTFPLASPLGVERWTLGVGRWALYGFSCTFFLQMAPKQVYFYCRQ